ncbi:hypothetical protein CDL15_Pgr021892 [Punica granatum]|uniref:Uncharacterized protein n=1 Tax=Punica granatum TaxID=22663 RepID=A0A218WS94_PUNGR|nr:hypothetical protein CDL15_Pgr021892 [Punica granatum]PKI54560.1 hypothetical protein CRG98_025074 [Punica granatum]
MEVREGQRRRRRSSSSLAEMEEKERGGDDGESHGQRKEMRRQRQTKERRRSKPQGKDDMDCEDGAVEGKQFGGLERAKMIRMRMNNPYLFVDGPLQSQSSFSRSPRVLIDASLISGELHICSAP